MPVIEVQGLHKRYGDKVAVDDVSFDVERGEIFGVLGPNGAGKTTTVECLEGLRKPDRGRLSVLGLDPRHETAELRQRLGVQLQESRLPDKIREGDYIEFGNTGAYGRAIASRFNGFGAFDEAILLDEPMFTMYARERVEQQEAEQVQA